MGTLDDVMDLDETKGKNTAQPQTENKTQTTGANTAPVATSNTQTPVVNTTPAPVANTTATKVETPQTPTVQHEEPHADMGYSNGNSNATVYDNNDSDIDAIANESNMTANNYGGNTKPTPSAIHQRATESREKVRTFEDALQRIYDEEMARNKQNGEEDEKLRKKAIRDERIAAIADGISALANMWGTYHGAKNMYDPQNSMTDRARKRYEKIKAEREKKRQNYMNSAMGKYKILSNREAADVASANANDKMELAQAKADNERLKESNTQNYRNMQLLLGGKRLQGQQDAADRTYQQNVEKLNETKRHNKAMEANAYAKESRLAADGSGSSSGGKNSYTVTLNDGSTYTYNKSQIGAINSLSTDMISKARIAAGIYGKNGEYDKEEHYNAVADALEKANSAASMNAIIVSNIHDFPTMQDSMRKVLGVGGKGKSGKKATTKKAQKANNTSTKKAWSVDNMRNNN